MIKNSVITVFGSGNCDRPCNVLADTERNKIYYFLIEETQQNIGTNDFTGMAKTVMYVYDYNSESGEIILNRKEDIIPESSVGKIRMGSYIDSSGNIILAYGQYDGILKVHIFDVENNIWTIQQTMSNYDNDTLMYAYVIMENLQNFYVLCVQDTSKNGEVYYQYVKLFACNNENWTSTMVVDYRNSSIAETETSIVEHTELCFINNKIHLITRSKKMKEIIHYIYKDGQLIKQDTDFLSNNYEWIRLIELNEKMYYVANKTGIIPTLDVIDAEKKEVVFSYMGISISSYIYLNKNWNNNEIQVLCIPSFKTTYKYLKEQIFFIKLK